MPTPSLTRRPVRRLTLIERVRAWPTTRLPRTTRNEPRRGARQRRTTRPAPALTTLRPVGLRQDEAAWAEEAANRARRSGAMKSERRMDSGGEGDDGTVGERGAGAGRVGGVAVRDDEARGGAQRTGGEVDGGAAVGAPARAGARQRGDGGLAGDDLHAGRARADRHVGGAVVVGVEEDAPALGRGGAVE